MPSSYVPLDEIRALRHLVRHRIFLGRYRGIIKNQIKNAEREIEKAGKQYEEVKLMTGIKGIGVYSALIIYLEIEDYSRFLNEEKAFSYAGLVPRVHQSGNTSYYGRITKEGSKFLRWILVEAVRVHVQWCPNSKITKHYNKIKNEKQKSLNMTME